jgi:PAS domain S-box-containing protein
MKNSTPNPPDNVMDLLLDAICVVDPQGHFLSVTGACERIFGYTPEEMVGKQMMDLIYHEDHERTQRQVEKIMSGYEQRHFENRYVRKDGSVVHIMWSARWSEDHKVRVAVARDITERKQIGAPHLAAEILPDAAPRWRLSASPPQLTPPGHAPIPLSAQDYTVLLALAKGGDCVTREAIVRALGEHYESYDRRRLDTQMRRLRRKVEEACGLQLPVTTLRGAGYRFYDDVEICR